MAPVSAGHGPHPPGAKMPRGAVMKPGRHSVIALALLSFAIGCDKKNDNPVAPQTTETGTILVSVVDAQGYVVSAAQVITNPKIGSGNWVTDGLGQVLLEDVPVNLYTIAATHSALGSARDAASVTSGSLSHVNLRLVAGVFLEPQVRILTPFNGAVFSYVDSLNLLGSVTDIQDRPDSLKLRWS